MNQRRAVLRGLGALAAGPATAGRDYYAELGVPRMINAAGAYSALGGARMRDPVVSAMRYAATNKVKIRELHDAVGARIAELVGAEGAMVTSGATASIVLATAACMTRGDEDQMQRLPDVSGMMHEVIIQKAHRNTYDRALWVPGAKLVQVASEDELRAAVSERTAMLFFLQPTHNGDDIPAARYIQLAKEFGVPCFCDAATTTPPATNIVDSVKAGFDLVCYSGGKGLRGPYSAGLLIGRADLIAYARMNAAPNDRSIGRGMKVSAEEYLGMLVALETALAVDEEEDFAWKRRRFANIIREIADVPGVTAEVFLSPGTTNELYLDVDWDPRAIAWTKPDFIDALRNHAPSVEVRLPLFSGGRVHLSATVLAEGEDLEVGKILRSVLLQRA